jgi:hypothetical protein
MMQLTRVGCLRIDPTQDWELAYWTRKLGVSPETLRRAIEANGSRIANVAAFLLEESTYLDAGDGHHAPRAISHRRDDGPGLSP